MIQSHCAATLSRLLAVDWSGDTSFAHARSRVRLMGEYLRRAAWWAQDLNATSRWPFFDIADCLAPSVHVPDELAEELEALIDARVGWPAVAVTCRAALRWAALLDAGIPLPPRLDDPFEPLLLMFERGGGFITEHGFIDVDGASIRQETWRDHLSTEPVVSLDLAVLDALDAAEKTARPEQPS